MRLTGFSFIFVYILCLTFLIEAKKGKLVRLDEETWSQMLDGEWMVEFYAPWCPACKQLEPQWDQFSTWSDDLGIRIGAVDVTTNPGLSGRFMVTALPTIYHVKDGVFRQYRGPRDTNSFVTFVEEKQWEKLETLPGWKNPASAQMSLVSYFFKISMALRAVHNRLVEEYGIPYWASYILFALATIFLGAILGLLIVCFIDIVFPAKGIEYPPEVLQRQKAAASGDDATQSTKPKESGDETNDTEDKKEK
ncbi:Thioredoxin-related transmembrane protein 1 [Halotydeus destructor]|nr:Thioredoxin-related transmembrane protein 1 [Halotydeus destructor]